MTRVRFAFVFIAVVSLVSALAAQQPPTPPSQTPPDDFLKGVYLSDTKHLVASKVIKEVKPKYTVAAMRNKLQGRVWVQAVVMPDGTVGRARVMESLDKVHGLDEAALTAVKQWVFEAAKLNGQAVAVAIELYLDFRLH